MTGRRLLYALMGAFSLSVHTHASIETPRLRGQVVEVEDEGASEHAVAGVDAYGAVQEQPVEFTEDEAEDSVQEGAKGDGEDSGASEDGAASLSVGRPTTGPPKAAQEIGGDEGGSRSHAQSEGEEDESIGSIPVGRPGRVHSSGSHTGILGPDMEYGPDGKPRPAKPSTVPDPSVDTLDHKRNTNGFDLPNGEHVGLDVPSPVRVKHDNKYVSVEAANTEVHFVLECIAYPRLKGGGAGMRRISLRCLLFLGAVCSSESHTVIDSRRRALRRHLLVQENQTSLSGTTASLAGDDADKVAKGKGSKKPKQGVDVVMRKGGLQGTGSTKKGSTHTSTPQPQTKKKPANAEDGSAEELVEAPGNGSTDPDADGGVEPQEGTSDGGDGGSKKGSDTKGAKGKRGKKGASTSPSSSTDDAAQSPDDDSTQNPDNVESSADAGSNPADSVSSGTEDGVGKGAGTDPEGDGGKGKGKGKKSGADGKGGSSSSSSTRDKDNKKDPNEPNNNPADQWRYQNGFSLPDGRQVSVDVPSARTDGGRL